MSVNKKLLKTISIIYISLMLAFAVFWGNYWGSYSKFKFDYAAYTLDYVFALTYLFLIIFYFTVRKVNLLVLLVIPLVVAFLSLLGAIVFLSVIQSRPSTDIYIYVITYCIIGISVVFLWDGWLERKERQVTDIN